MEDDLSTLIGAYGITAIHKALINRMKDEYSYLKKIFEEKEKPVKEEKEKPIKEEKENPVVPVITVAEVATTAVEEITKFRDPKEMKEWQRGQEELKKKENESKGIKKETLLTKENLRKWIEEEGRTFSYISREYVGCKDSEVSAAAKLFGIDTTRKNVTVKSTTKKQ
jgi:tRNA/tmRNA/rRNA uracil-C5-methylase (TrmA/RlmC/RlmD family)